MRPIYVYAPLTSNNNPGVTETKHFVKNEYDFEQEKDIDDPLTELYHLMNHAYESKQDEATGYIIIGGDQVIDLPIIYAANDFVSRHDGHLVTIVFDNEININKEVTTIDNKNVYTNIDNNILNLPIINQYHKSQTMFVGHHDSPHAYDFSNISMKKVQQFDTEAPNILVKMIKDYCIDKDIKQDNLILHISIDTNVFKYDIAPSVLNVDDAENKIERDGLELNSVINIIKELSNNFVILSMSLSEFDPLWGSDKDNRKTVECLRQCMINAFDIKEKKINFVNEDTQFIVYRPFQQVDIEDVGWYILRQIDVDTKDNITKHIEIDKIVIETIDDIDIMFALTTVREQNAKIYHNGCKISDIILFPEEKKAMIFELINVPINDHVVDHADNHIKNSEK